MALNFAIKAFSYNLARFWTSFCCKLYNILLSRMPIRKNFGLLFWADSFLNFLFDRLLSFFLSLSILFIFYPFSPFYPLEKFWPRPFKKLEREHWSTRCLGLFYHQVCSQNWTRDFWYSSARIWSIFKMDTHMDWDELSVLAAYQNNLVSEENDDVTSGSMSPNSNVGKYDSWRERVKGAISCFFLMCAVFG